MLPDELAAAGEVEIRVLARDERSTPFVTEIRTEAEGVGLKPRLE
jgi:hypothetical protein